MSEGGKSFTSSHSSLSSSIKQPILLMCQIDIVIEKAVDVFVVFLVWEELKAKHKLENIEIDIHRRTSQRGAKTEPKQKKKNNIQAGLLSILLLSPMNQFIW